MTPSTYLKKDQHLIFSNVCVYMCMCIYMKNMFSKPFNKNSHLLVLISMYQLQRQTLVNSLTILFFFIFTKHVYRALS